MAKRVNVLLHGIFGYVFERDYISVYVPAVHSHIYRVGMKFDASDSQPLSRADYMLTGVCAGSKFKPDGTQSPVLSLAKGTKIDEFNKRYCKITLPYPAPFEGCGNQVCAVDRYIVGSIFAGRDSDPCNNLENFPSMHIFIYERDDSPLMLNSPHDETIDLSGLEAKNEIVNLHIWGTTPPMDMSHMGATPDGHLRRGFAALVDMFPLLELTMQIPDGFTPAAADALPIDGVTACDIDPSLDGCAPTHFGKVNCRYANLVFTDGS